MTNVKVSRDVAPAYGDLRALRAGDTVWVHPSARDRADWGRIVEAVAGAISRGAEVRAIVPSPEEIARNDWKRTR